MMFGNAIPKVMMHTASFRMKMILRRGVMSLYAVPSRFQSWFSMGASLGARACGALHALTRCRWNVHGQVTSCDDCARQGAAGIVDASRNFKQEPTPMRKINAVRAPQDAASAGVRQPARPLTSEVVRSLI